MKRFLLLTLVLAATTLSAYAQFTFTSLDFPGGTKTTARGINNRGSIVGSYRIDPPRHALAIRHGHFVPLAGSGPLGANFSEAFKINDHGDVVGDYDDGVTHGFLLHKGVLTTLDFPGADATIAFGINDSGVVVGEWDLLDAQGNLLAYHGFLWKNRAFSDVNFPGSADTSILSINSEGDYVGLWDSDVNAPAGHAFVKTEDRFSSFDVPDATLTLATDINEDGKIVGLVQENELTEAQRAVREINFGAYVFDRAFLERTLPTLEKHLAGEYYLTDLISTASEVGVPVESVRAPFPDDQMGVNDPTQLERAAGVLRQRNRRQSSIAIGS